MSEREIIAIVGLVLIVAFGLLMVWWGLKMSEKTFGSLAAELVSGQLRQRDDRIAEPPEIER